MQKSSLRQGELSFLGPRWLLGIGHWLPVLVLDLAGSSWTMDPLIAI